MKVALELEFPDEQAAAVMRRLQDVPEMTIRFLQSIAALPSDSAAKSAIPAKRRLSEREQHALLDRVFGSWQQEEGEEDLMSQIYGARRDAPREVDL